MTETPANSTDDLIEGRCVGVDGCHAGWIAVTRAGGQLVYRLHTNFAAVLREHASAALILIDIPIGLPSKSHTTRPCDELARAVLGPRRASVFSPPSRLASRASNVAEARERNQAEVGRSLSAQAWGICRKIVEVDEILLNDPELSRCVLEVHPEVCFCALNRGMPMHHPKRRPAGIQERLATLRQWIPDPELLLSQVLDEHRRKEVGRDDVLDALVAHVTGEVGLPDLQRLVGDPGKDALGLPMQMVYRGVLALDGPKIG
jgi:predicted RNase H-like nuclease